HGNRPRRDARCRLGYPVDERESAPFALRPSETATPIADGQKVWPQLWVVGNRPRQIRVGVHGRCPQVSGAASLSERRAKNACVSIEGSASRAQKAPIS